MSCVDPDLDGKMSPGGTIYRNTSLDTHGLDIPFLGIDDSFSCKKYATPEGYKYCELIDNVVPGALENTSTICKWKCTKPDINKYNNTQWDSDMNCCLRASLSDLGNCKNTFCGGTSAQTDANGGHDSSQCDAYVKTFCDNNKLHPKCRCYTSYKYLDGQVNKGVLDQKYRHPKFIDTCSHDNQLYTNQMREDMHLVYTVCQCLIDVGGPLVLGTNAKINQTCGGCDVKVTQSTDTEPTDTEPTDTEPTDTEPTDTEPTAPNNPNESSESPNLYIYSGIALLIIIIILLFSLVST